MTSPASRLTPYALRFKSLAQRLTLFTAALFSIFYFFTALPRIVYPYDLDFLEDSTLMQVRQLAQWQVVYGPPSIEFIPHLYMPLYFSIGAGLVNLFGLSYVPLRLISFATTLTTTSLLFYITRRETKHNWLALVIAGLYLGGYRISGFWYELARVDSLFVALSLGGLALGFYANGSRPKQIVATLVLALAFFTKQTALALGVCLLFYWWFAQRWQVLWFAALYVGLCFGGFYWFDQTTGHWFSHYTLTGASVDPVEIGRVFHYIGLELFGVMFGLSVLAVATVWQVGRRAGVGGLRREPWLLAIGAAAVISGVGRASVGGNLNNLMSVYAFLCLTPALFWKFTSSSAYPDFNHIKQLVICIALLLQFALGIYNPIRYIPTAEMRASGDRLIERIAAIEGEVFVMIHPYYALLAGKEPSAQLSALWHDFHWRGLPPPVDLIARIENQYYAAIISDESLFETDPIIQDILRTYYFSEPLPLNQSPLSPVGLAVRPTLIYIPK